MSKEMIDDLRQEELRMAKLEELRSKRPNFTMGEFISKRVKDRKLNVCDEVDIERWKEFNRLTTTRALTAKEKLMMRCIERKFGVHGAKLTQF